MSCVRLENTITDEDPSIAGELVFGVARIFASFNDTFVHVTDLRFVHPSKLQPTTAMKAGPDVDAALSWEWHE